MRRAGWSGCVVLPVPAVDGNTILEETSDVSDAAPVHDVEIDGLGRPVVAVSVVDLGFCVPGAVLPDLDGPVRGPAVGRVVMHSENFAVGFETHCRRTSCGAGRPTRRRGSRQYDHHGDR